MPGSKSYPENSTRAIHPPTCDCLSSKHVFSPRADNNAATVRPPIPPPTTTTSYALIPSLLENVFVYETTQHDQHRLNAVEDDVHDESRKDFAGNGSRHRQRDAQQSDHNDYSDVVAVLKDVHAGKQQ